MYNVLCNLSPPGSIWISETFGLVYCNAVAPMADLVYALFEPYAAMFVSQIYPEKSLNTSFVVLENPEFSLCKSWKVMKTVFFCMYEP